MLPLKELAMGTPYSQEYLSLRVRQGLLDAVKIGKTWHSSRRAVEQYLSEHGKRMFDFLFLTNLLGRDFGILKSE